MFFMNYNELYIRRNEIYEIADEYQCNNMRELYRLFNILSHHGITESLNFMPIKNIIVYFHVISLYIDKILESMEWRDLKDKFLDTILIYCKKVLNEISFYPNKEWLKILAIHEINHVYSIAYYKRYN